MDSVTNPGGNGKPELINVSPAPASFRITCAMMVAGDALSGMAFCLISPRLAAGLKSVWRIGSFVETISRTALAVSALMDSTLVI